MDTEQFFREHGYYPVKSDPHVNTNTPQTDAEREQFFLEHGYYFASLEESVGQPDVQVNASAFSGIDG